MVKRIAVIGAGSTGMTATKQCLEQGLDVVVYEKTNYTGGLWRYQEKLDEDGIASVMKSTIINTSKEMSAFSDFPPAPEFPNFMHNTKMVSTGTVSLELNTRHFKVTYFDQYANSFNFTKYVRFRQDIVSVEQAEDYELTGRWKVTARNLDNPSEVSNELYDGVMICTGHHNRVNEPKFKGQEKFRGQIVHTHSLKSSKGFEDKNVVVVGIGNSGGDAAVEVSLVAKQVYHSTRRGTWLWHRVGYDGRPLDQLINRRWVWTLIGLLPYSFACSLIEIYLNTSMNHERYQLKPKHRCFSQHIFINDSLPNRILSGTVTVKGDIDHFEENGVVFKGEDKVTPCDAVILATGYKVSFPFLSQDILPITHNKVRLYKHEFIHNLRHPHTLALIGLIQPIGAIFPVSEMQSRWFALLMNGKLKLPSQAEMEKDMQRQDQDLARYYESERHTIQVDWVPFMDELAHEIGVYPPLWKYLFTAPKLLWTLLFGANASYQYRLVGPNSWSGAREAMLTVQDRINAPLQTKKDKQPSQDKLTNYNIFHLFILVLLLAVAFSTIFSALFTAIFT